MLEKAKLIRYKKLYGKIKRNYYSGDYASLKECCKKEKITPSTYYKICKTLERPSVGTDRIKYREQKGGSKTTVLERFGNEKTTVLEHLKLPAQPEIHQEPSQIIIEENYDDRNFYDETKRINTNNYNSPVITEEDEESKKMNKIHRLKSMRPKKRTDNIF